MYSIIGSKEEMENPIKCLVGTAEIPLAGYNIDRVYNASDLPKRFVGFGRCFRVETGGAGQHNRGLYRLHQFTKVEMFSVTDNDRSDEELEFLVKIQQELFSELGLPFRVLDMPTEELGASAHRKYDIEAWMPSKQHFGEVSSASNCTEYQARRLNLKVKTADQKTHLAHTLNATACAIPRVILAILENHQLADGSIRLPSCLSPFMGGRTHLSPRK